MATLIDLASGLLVTNILGRLYHQQLSWWVYGLGVFWSFLPDIDMIPTLIDGKKEVDNGHKETLHYPLIAAMLGLAMYVLVATVNPTQKFWPALMFATIMLHFVHDSLGDTNWWGLMWAFPFNRRTYLALGHRDRETREFSWIVSLTPEERQQLEPRGMREWLEKFYLRPSWESIIGPIYLLASLGVLAIR